MEVLFFFGILALAAIVAIIKNMAGNDDPHQNYPSQNNLPTTYSGEQGPQQIHIHNSYPPQMNPYGHQPYGGGYGGGYGGYDHYGRRGGGWGGLLAIGAVAIGFFMIVIKPGVKDHAIETGDANAPKQETSPVVPAKQPENERLKKIFDAKSISEPTTDAYAANLSPKSNTVVIGKYPSESAAKAAAQEVYKHTDMEGYDLRINSEIQPGVFMLIIRCINNTAAQGRIDELKLHRDELKEFCPREPYLW